MTWKVIPASLGAPKCTNFPLKDIMIWLDEGSIVRLYDSRNEKLSLVFDKECGRKKGEVFRVIWVDFYQRTDLLKKENVPHALKERKYTLCRCSIAKRIAEGEIESHRTYRRNLLGGLRPLFPRF